MNKKNEIEITHPTTHNNHNKMNFSQTKLNKKEWDGIEILLPPDKVNIVRLIMGGFHDTNIKTNSIQSLLSFLKIENSPQMDDYIYNTYFLKKIGDLHKMYRDDALLIKTKATAKIGKADLIRINNNTAPMTHNTIYEFIVYDFIAAIVKRESNWLFHYYTLHKIATSTIPNINKNIAKLVKQVLDAHLPHVSIPTLIYNSYDYIEKNKNLFAYSDIVLYDHQKQIFAEVGGDRPFHPKLILYIAPTGTGKTMTPIGLSEKYRVIYVCASRHVSLSLAKACISVGKKIAFAFGCRSTDDIKLHYFAAKEYTRNKKTGGIGKVDNSVGDKVEIILCDVVSYLYAMYYMIAFFPKEEILAYFDEPTIFLDYREHELHDVIHKNWNDNVIPTVVLSSATLPKSHEIPDTIADFIEKFESAEVVSIVSYDCKKTIPIIDNCGYISMPHYISTSYDDMIQIATFCAENPTLLRYLDLRECVAFIKFVEEEGITTNTIETYFGGIEDVSMERIKFYYLALLKKIRDDQYDYVIGAMNGRRRLYMDSFVAAPKAASVFRKIRSMDDTGNGAGGALAGMPLRKSVSLPDVEMSATTTPTPDFGLYLTTKDAYTLTDGPTLFITDNIEKVAQFCIRNANMPEMVMNDITAKIDYNNRLSSQIADVEHQLDDIQAKKGIAEEGEKKTKEINEEKDVGAYKLTSELERLQCLIKSIEINEVYVPNKPDHIAKWCGVSGVAAYTSDIDERIIVRVMALNVDNCWKVLLLMGIGVFSNHIKDTNYNEIMKELADKQQLYLIISNSDYIYGTNYQFCHLYIGKDMTMTQEKIIQSLGRVGRGNIQQSYSVRFRDNEGIRMLFSSTSYKPEVENMNRLFTSTVKDV
jgi:hypothetical protein